MHSENKRKVEMIQQLKEAGYRSDPVKAWKAVASVNNDPAEEDEGVEDGDGGEEEQADFNYLLSMPMWSLTREKKEELLKNRDKKVRNNQTC